MYPVTLSLLARLSLFGVDLGWGASCDVLDTVGHLRKTKTKNLFALDEENLLIKNLQIFRPFCLGRESS